MTRDEFQALMAEQFDRLLAINTSKGHDYAGEEDALANFKRHAGNLGLRPEQIWAVYANKHWDAINTYCREGAVQSEPVEGRIDDALLYLFLLRGLVEESKEAEPHIMTTVSRANLVDASPNQCATDHRRGNDDALYDRSGGCSVCHEDKPIYYDDMCVDCAEKMGVDVRDSMG